MACYHPLTAYQSTKEGKDGKRSVQFRPPGGAFTTVYLPCGQCIGCRIDRSRDWALRCVHEASMHDENCFITLTFDQENVNERGTLVKDDFRRFIKKLRKAIYPSRVRYFHCGEYGGNGERPHHHACLFGFCFGDRKIWSIRNGVRLYRSDQLERIWAKGYCTVGDVNYESAAYCARYVTKKVTGEKADEHYRRVDVDTGEIYQVLPEYCSCSTRPGIGKAWFEKYGETDLYSKDFVTFEGRKYPAPRYYDKLYRGRNQRRMEDIKNARARRGSGRVEDNTLVRLRVREKCQISSMSKLERSYENGSKDI